MKREDLDGYNTDGRLIEAIEALAGVRMSGTDRPEYSKNPADMLWCDGYIGNLSPSETQRRLLEMLPPPEEGDVIWWGETKFATEKNGDWVLV